MAIDLNDKTSNGNTLTNSASTEVSSNLPFAASSTAVAFNGSNQYLYAADSASLSITSSLTIECWVKFASLPTSNNVMTLICKYSTTSDKRSYLLQLFNNGGTMQIFGETSTDGTNQPDNQKAVNWSPSTGTWYHVAWVYDHTAPNFKFYINGAQQGTTQTVTGTSIANTDRRLSIATRDADAGGSLWLEGELDDIRIWAAVRTEAQILANYQYEMAGTDTGLNAYYPFEASLTTAPVAAGPTGNPPYGFFI